MNDELSLKQFESNEKQQQDKKLPKEITQSINSMSDMSPIARPIGEDNSQYQESRYTNILDSLARSVQAGDSDKPTEQRKFNRYKHKQSMLDFIGSPAASVDDPSFLISDRSINIPDIK